MIVIYTPDFKILGTMSFSFETLESDVMISDMEESIVDSGSLTLEDDTREHLNIVFIGHVDAGKSTISGQVLYSWAKFSKLKNNHN